MRTPPIFAAGTPPSRFKMVYFLYDENHVPETRAVEDLVKAAHPEVRFIALHGPRMPLLPLLKLYESQMQTWESQVRPFLVENSLLVGIGLTGTAAAVLQERLPELNLSVLTVNSPTTYGPINLKKADHRVALYSRGYLAGSCETWPTLSDVSFDVSWLRYGILSESGGNLCKYLVSLVVAAYIKEPNIKSVLSKDLMS